MSEVKTFWVEPIDLFHYEIIVLWSEGPCPCCSARVTLADKTPDNDYVIPPRDDPRWPTHCKRCSIAFPDGDEVHHASGLNRYYEGGGHRATLNGMPPGASWDASWMGDNRTGPDGIALIVKLPNGMDWCVDGPATNSDTAWDRTGDPKKANVTAHPSIGSRETEDPGYYHGFLTDGVLKAVAGSRT